MPSPEVMLSFREGLKIVQSADDFATMRHIIDKMIGICPSEELHMAKDAIARVIRAKQATDIKNYEGYPQAIDELDKKYRDLYIVLRTSKSNTASQPPQPSQSQPQAKQGSQSFPGNNQIAKVRGLGGLNMPMMVLDWLKSKRKFILAGGAVGAVGGAYLLYKQLSGDKEERINPDKDSSFDKTIKSIQKYKAFSQMMIDPNFSGDYSEITTGKHKKTKKKEIVKKEEANKSIEWEKDERNLMRDMDEAFNVLATKPELDYQLPQLPAPKNIDPRVVLGEDKPIELSPREPGRKIKREKAKEGYPTPKARKPRKPRKPRQSRKIEPEIVQKAEISESAPPAPKKERARMESSTSENSGRLIPIVKRTKRVKKVAT